MGHRTRAVWVACALLSGASHGLAQTLTTYGTPGLIDMPTADVFEDGHIGLTSSAFGPISRNTLAFQVFPRVYGTFRYSITQGLVPGVELSGGDLFDRSVDFHLQLSNETLRWPAFAVGLRDVGGTGTLSSEYIVATKTFRNRLKVTGGLGWGRLATRGTFDNPLGLFGNRFDTRPEAAGGTGEFDADLWFRGPAALFAGLDYRINDRFNVQLEYSTDAYKRETDVGIIDIGAPINLGLNYRFRGGAQIKAFTIGGTEFGVQYSYTFDPAQRRSPGGLDKAPLPIDLIDPVRDGRTNTADRLATLLDSEGITLENLTVDGPRATIQITNQRWDIEAQAVARAARAMSQVFPPDITTFTIVLKTRDLPNSAVTLARSDLKTLETDYDGAWRSLARARITDAADIPPTGALPDLYPRLTYGLGPYLALSLFDPSDPIRYDIGPEFSVAFTPSPGLSFNGVFRQPLEGTIEDSDITSDSVLPKV
ncbi:MAG: YjbH domain-containing protein, partial [Pseudomonadota bacterium]